ncbi:MAG: hypothetical protein VZQ47_11525 [Treponema sp.]|nr:hypothetical protein [Treponema sp.]MEE3436172.1 hypothetical protein [Treponema sp.]
MKLFKLLFLVAIAVFFSACSSPAGSDANSNAVSNGGSTQATQGNDPSSSAQNECDMGSDFDLEYWKDKIYVNGTLPPQHRVESNHIGLQSNASDTLEFYLTIQKNGNKMIVNKDAGWGPKNNWFEIDSIKKTSNNRVDIKLKSIK